ncbi:MAG: hypothetical protein WBQ18_00325, partial [Solirubrobacteraceae bacterium]
VRPEVSYEGQAAIEFEACCAVGPAGAAYVMPVLDGDEGFVLDPRELIRALSADRAGGVPVGEIATAFHAAVAAGTAAACARAAEQAAVNLVVLSGGVFANRRLLEAVLAGLDAHGLRTLVPRRLPVGDGGIAFGQVAVAAARLRAGLPVDGAVA